VAHGTNYGTAVFIFPRAAMHFDQGEFNFDAGGSETGYRRWREELDAAKQAFERRWGVILSRRVVVSLADHAKPLTGVLDWRKGPDGKPVFRIRGLEFTAEEIESIVQEEDGPPENHEAG
jgi:hypothetical protein